MAAVPSTDLKELIRAVVAGFKAMETKTSRLQGAVEHLTSLVTTNTGKVDGLAVRMQATATAQATTASTLVQFRQQMSGVLDRTASGSPSARVVSNSGESPGGGAVAADDIGDKRNLIISIRVLLNRRCIHARGKSTAEGVVGRAGELVGGAPEASEAFAGGVGGGGSGASCLTVRRPSLGCFDCTILC